MGANDHSAQHRAIIERNDHRQSAEFEARRIAALAERAALREIPGAYKAIEQVMENQRDLVEVVAQLRQVLCVKG